MKAEKEKCGLCEKATSGDCCIVFYDAIVCERCRTVGKKLGFTDDALMAMVLREKGYLGADGKMIRENIPTES